MVGRRARTRGAARSDDRVQKFRARGRQRLRHASGDGVFGRRRVRKARCVVRTETVTLFPDPRRARGDIIAIGEDLSPGTLRDAYRHGIFPWPHDELPLPWFSPRRRAVIFFDELHVGRTLRRARRGDLHFTTDGAFAEVIAACATVPRGDDVGTWIGPEIVAA